MQRHSHNSPRPRTTPSDQDLREHPIVRLMSTSTKYRKRKMSATSPRRNSLFVSTAILLAGAPNYCHAHNLRRSSDGGTKSKSSMAIVRNLDIEGEGVHGGVEVVGGPIYHSSTTYERRRSTMQEDEMELEDVVEPNEFIYDNSLVSVSLMSIIRKLLSLSFRRL